MNALDQSLFLFFNLSYAAPAWAVKAATWGGLTLLAWLAVAALTAVALGRKPWPQGALRILIAMALASFASVLLKHVIGMPRPGMLGLGHQWVVHAMDNGFPSSHAAVAAAWALAMAATPLRRWMLLVAAAVALFVGWCRIALGLHFPSQVLVGWVLGLICGGIALMLPPALIARLEAIANGVCALVLLRRAD